MNWKPAFAKTFLFISFMQITAFAALSQGKLVIVGGGLEANNKDVFKEMIQFAGGAEKATFAVIPSASGVAMQSWVYFQKTLISYGVKTENIHLIKIAMVDDDSTTDVDESKWWENGNDESFAKTVKGCSVVWFTGGDQARTLATLKNADGSNTLVLNAVWEMYNSGGVVGGTSAGAAIMSEVMICGGNSLGALTHGAIQAYHGDDFPEADGVLVGKGLGFFPVGIVDQHFAQRARIGRLIVTLMMEKENFHMGFGVDENTALIYDSGKKLIQVAGAGGVTIVNVSEASISYADSLPKIDNINLSYLENGDTYEVASGKIIPVAGKKLTVGNEYYNIQNPGQTGIFSAYSSDLKNLMTINLIDNKGADSVKNLSFYNQNSGFLVTLSKTPNSEGFYTDKPDGADHYTVSNVLMYIAPVKVNVIPVETEK
jgi:cyanophycinase